MGISLGHLLIAVGVGGSIANVGDTIPSHVDLGYIRKVVEQESKLANSLPP